MKDTEKQAYQDKMESKLEQVKSDIEHMEAGMKEKKADVRIEASEQMRNLRAKAKAARTKIEGL